MFALTGPEAASHRVVLAPGDEGRLGDRSAAVIGSVLAQAGIRVIRFAAPLCDSDDGEVRDELWRERIRAAAGLCGGRLVLGGFSRGARVSVGLLYELGAVGLLGLAYPFHPRTDPDPGGRVAQLAAVPVPALICQGTRDSHGNRQQILGYRLPSRVRVHWIEDANHALWPRGSDDPDPLWRFAGSEAAAFVRSL